MKEISQKLLIAATVLTVLGIVIIAAVYAASGFDIKKFETVKFETTTYNINEDFKYISIYADIEDVDIVVSDDDRCRIVCYNQEGLTYPVEVKNNELSIGRIIDRPWYDLFEVSFEMPKMTVYLPKGEYDLLEISASTGDISIPDDFSFKKVMIEVSTSNVEFFSPISDTVYIETSTGNVTACGIKPNKFDVRTSTGKVSLKDVVADTRLSVRTSTGNVSLDMCDAGEISLETSTGNISGTLRSDKLFDVYSSTGKVSVPRTISGDTCHIRTSTGNINIEIP